MEIERVVPNGTVNVVILDKDAMTPKDRKKLESIGFVVVEVKPGRRCEIKALPCTLVPKA